MRDDWEYFLSLITCAAVVHVENIPVARNAAVFIIQARNAHNLVPEEHTRTVMGHLCLLDSLLVSRVVCRIQGCLVNKFEWLVLHFLSC